MTEIYVCGGGARNGALMRELAYCLQRPVHPTDALGVPAQQVEALASPGWRTVLRNAAPPDCPT